MNWLTIVGLVIVLVIVMAIAGWSLINLDLMSYTATGSEALSPTGAVAGNALVVYDPGVSGAAKSAAAYIAGDLQSRGYKVELAGIRSATAANTSGYDVVIAGGPMYNAKVVSTVEAYLKALTLQSNVKLGVFGTTGYGQLVDANIASLGTQVTSLPNVSSLNKTAATKTIRSGDAGNTDCSELVSAVLQ